MTEVAMRKILNANGLKLTRRPSITSNNLTAYLTRVSQPWIIYIPSPYQNGWVNGKIVQSFTDLAAVEAYVKGRYASS